jgi:mRNA interferase MazF
MVIQRGEIWWATLSDPFGSEPGYRRPLLIIQGNEFNASRISTVIAIVITSNLKLARAPGNVLLPKKVTGLPKDSVANVSQIITIDKNYLTERVGRISATFLAQIEIGLRLVLDL